MIRTIVKSESKFFSVVQIVIAAVAMVATFPGRTHGLGVITAPLLADMNLSPVSYADMNFWATLIGSVFCLPCGWLLDKFGHRIILNIVCLALGTVVILMSYLPTDDHIALFLLIVLTRGLGQSALSVISLTIMGKALGQRSGLFVAVYSILVALGFMATFAIIRIVEEYYQPTWRDEWFAIGIAVITVGMIGHLLLAVSKNHSPEVFSKLIGQNKGPGYTLLQAMRTHMFWVFALATSYYGMIAAGISLFNQPILNERNFDREIFLTISAAGPLIGLAANLGTGLLAGRYQLQSLLAVAMCLLAGALFYFPFVDTIWQLWIYVILMALAGGMVTVLFFAVWAKSFGLSHLGRIQGVAQMLTVFASAVGPRILAESQHLFESYVVLYPYFASIALALALWAGLLCMVRKPSSVVSKQQELEDSSISLERVKT